jgi:hypothetical protein
LIFFGGLRARFYAGFAAVRPLLPSVCFAFTALATVFAHYTAVKTVAFDSVSAPPSDQYARAVGAAAASIEHCRACRAFPGGLHADWVGSRRTDRRLDDDTARRQAFSPV